MNDNDIIRNGKKGDDENIESQENKEEYDETESNCIIHFLGAQTRRAEIGPVIKVQAEKLLEEESVRIMRSKFVHKIMSNMEHIYDITKSRHYQTQ